ncbi:MAG TPA: flavin reductase family protein [Ktedonobacteraceae bacterium]|jgi:flavin reductase (DIM6/NTAB) family NADH-FMN oxidoreductase RutF|nr:flavin reductase family protein [Ktedonobacteraceae bacterium]
MAIEKDFFRQVMGQFATGVTVATTCEHGRAAGLTVNSFTSVSLDPPLVLICVDLRSNVLPHFRESGVFAVNILTNRQEALSRCFATMSEERYENFCHASYHVAATGAPIIDGVLAFIDARIIAEYPGGDHAIFLGQVEAMGTDGEVVFATEPGKRSSTLTEYLPKGSSEIDILEAKKARMPLAYYRGQYRHLSRDYQRPSLAAYYDEDFE